MLTELRLPFFKKCYFSPIKIPSKSIVEHYIHPLSKLFILMRVTGMQDNTTAIFGHYAVSTLNRFPTNCRALSLIPGV